MNAPVKPTPPEIVVYREDRDPPRRPRISTFPTEAGPDPTAVPGCGLVALALAMLVASLLLGSLYSVAIALTKLFGCWLQG
jgi:hypothetical protein